MVPSAAPPADTKTPGVALLSRSTAESKGREKGKEVTVIGGRVVERP